VTLAGFALAVGLSGCGGGDDRPSATPSSSPSASGSTSSATTDTSPSGTDTRSMFRQVLEVKQALTQAEVSTAYAHARISVEVADGKPGGFTASGRLDLLSDPERFTYSLRFADQDFIGTYVSVDGKTYSIGLDGTPSPLPPKWSAYLFYWLNPLDGAHSLEADISEVLAVTTEELGSVETTHYGLRGAYHGTGDGFRYTLDVWLDGEDHVVKRIAVVRDLTVTMTFDAFDQEVVVEKPGSGGTDV
jgi:hypothetical protein